MNRDKILEVNRDSMKAEEFDYLRKKSLERSALAIILVCAFFIIIKFFNGEEAYEENIICFVAVFASYFEAYRFYRDKRSILIMVLSGLVVILNLIQYFMNL